MLVPRPALLLAGFLALTAFQEPEPEPRRPRPSFGLPGWARNAWKFRREIDAVWVLKGGNVVDVRTGAVAEGVNVILKGDVIQSIGREPAPAGAMTVDAADKWIVPGYVDLHAHVMPEGGLFDSPPEAEQMEALLHAGVTTIRLLPLTSEFAAELAAKVSLSRMKGPSCIFATTILEQVPQRTSWGFGTPENAAAWVHREALVGARWVKIYNAMDEPSLRAIVAAARQHGMKVCGHAEGVPPREASEIGQATIEHMIDIARSCLPDGMSDEGATGLFQKATWYWSRASDEKLAELMELFRRNGTGWVPTLVISEQILDLGAHDGRPIPQDQIDLFRAALERSAKLAVHLHRIGGLVGTGSDFPVNGVEPGVSIHREMQLLVELGGATPLEALQMATLSPARILGHEALFGTVEAGKLANLVVLGANPLEDIANAAAVEIVVHDGRIYRPD